jgi:SAM-dependent methyltransferase
MLERLESSSISKIEQGQRTAFLDLLRDANLSNGSRALSVSCGNGIWDYLALRAGVGITRVDATDIVACAVHASDQAELRSRGEWQFHQTEPDASLPFENDVFDVVFHQDVIEHTARPYHFIREQHRVLRSGGVLIVGTPNLLRPMNVLRAFVGRLRFPIAIGHNEQLGVYVHVQEFHSRQLELLLEESGFVDVLLRHVYFGVSTTNLCLSRFPRGQVGRTFAHVLIASAVKV